MGVDTQTLRAIDMWSKGNSSKIATKSRIALVEQKALQRKLDFHVFMLEIFKGLLTIMEVDHVKILTKNEMATNGKI